MLVMLNRTGGDGSTSTTDPAAGAARTPTPTASKPALITTIPPSGSTNTGTKPPPPPPPGSTPLGKTQTVSSGGMLMPKPMDGGTTVGGGANRVPGKPAPGSVTSTGKTGWQTENGTPPSQDMTVDSLIRSDFVQRYGKLILIGLLVVVAVGLIQK